MGFRLKTAWIFLKTLFIHKYWVLVYGRRLGIPLVNLLLHDLSKLYSFKELTGFLDKVRLDERVGRRLKAPVAAHASPRFKNAVRAHTSRRRHHWQHWLYIDSRHCVMPHPMPPEAAAEMVADWMAAGRTYNGIEDAFGWYLKNKHKMILHKDTIKLVETYLNVDSDILYRNNRKWR